MTFIFVISTPNNLRINKIYAWNLWRTCPRYLPKIPRYKFHRFWCPHPILEVSYWSYLNCSHWQRRSGETLRTNGQGRVGDSNRTLHHPLAVMGEKAFFAPEFFSTPESHRISECAKSHWAPRRVPAIKRFAWTVGTFGGHFEVSVYHICIIYLYHMS